jgi:hypothetical protein
MFLILKPTLSKMPKHNTVGIINELVTIFAKFSPCILTEIYSNIPDDLLAAWGIEGDNAGITGTMTGKNCAIASSHRDILMAK